MSLAPKRSKEDIAKLAERLFRGELFTDRHCSSPDEVGYCFPILNFLSKKQAKELSKHKGIVIYCPREDWGPWSINGKPQCLKSVGFIRAEDWKKIVEMSEKMKAAVEAAKK